MKTDALKYVKWTPFILTSYPPMHRQREMVATEATEVTEETVDHGDVLKALDHASTENELLPGDPCHLRHGPEIRV